MHPDSPQVKKKANKAASAQKARCKVIKRKRSGTCSKLQYRGYPSRVASKRNRLRCQREAVNHLRFKPEKGGREKRRSNTERGFPLFQELGKVHRGLVRGNLKRGGVKATS